MELWKQYPKPKEHLWHFLKSTLPPKKTHTFRRKWVKKVYTMLLLRKVLSSIRIHFIYSAKTGSSQRSFTQFFDIADWWREKENTAKSSLTRPTDVRNSYWTILTDKNMSALSGISKLYKLIIVNYYFTFSFYEVYSIWMQFITISTDLKGWCLGANYRLLLQRGKGPSLQWAHDNTQDLGDLPIFISSYQCLHYRKSWKFTEAGWSHFWTPHRLPPCQYYVLCRT